MFLSRTAKSVTIVSRRGLEDSMSHYLVQQIRSRPNIREMPNTVVHAVRGDGHLERICLEDVGTGERREHASGRMFIFIGAEPRTDWLGVWWCATTTDSSWPVPICARCQAGCSTGRRTTRKQACPACSLQVMRAESAKRVAAAVGEGSMAVMFVHRYLADG